MVPSKTQKIILIGAAGSGKDTQCGMLLGAIPGSAMLHMSEIFRHYMEVHPEMLQGQGWKLAAGELVTGDVAMSCLKKYVSEEIPSTISTLIFNGVPRGREQSLEFVSQFSQEDLQTFTAIFLDLDTATAMKRCLDRAEQDRKLGGTGRSDDTEATITRRLDLFVEHVVFLRSLLQSNGVACFMIDAVGSKEEVHRRVMACL